MRKKTKRNNSRKFRLRAFFTRRRADDEGDWFRFDEEAEPVRISPRKRIRRRLFAYKVAAIACLSISLPLSLNWGYGRVFFKNEEFVLRVLQIQTDGALSSARLAEVANVAAGMNLMKLDLTAIQAQVAKLPQVEKVTVTRELPDRLHMVVRERMPVAWLSSPPMGIRPWDMERGFLLDSEGYIFRCLDLNEGMKSLPVVESFKMAEPIEGTKIEAEGVLTALKVILASDKQFLKDELIVSEVKIRDEWAVECHYTNGLRVTFGIYDYERGMEDLALIHQRMAEAGRVLASVNVAAEKNIPVTFAESKGATETKEAMLPETQSTITAVTVETPDNSATDAVSAQEKHLRSILKGG